MDQNQFSSQVPPPPQTPEVKLRTMESDVGSIEKTGGAAPTPEFVASPIFKAETKDQTPSAVGLPEEKPGTSGIVRVIIWIVVILVALGLAAGAYYYYYLLPKGGVGIVAEPAPTPELEPAPEPVPLPPPTVAHASHFGFPNDIIPKVTVSDYSIVAILTALQNEANSPGTAGELREVLLIDSGGQPVTFSKFMATLMPELITNNLETTLRGVFEDDFTAYLYFDDKGVWPGYSVETKDDVDIDVVTLQDQLNGLESASFSNLFLTPPGTAQEFRTGTVKNVYTNRFVPLSQPGSSFNYGLFDGRLIVNTAYGGLLKALELMGL